MVKRSALLSLLSSVLLATPAPGTLPALYASGGAINSQSLPLTKLTSGQNYSILYSATGLDDTTSRVRVQIADGPRVLLEKTLHAGDSDFYATFHLEAAAHPELRVESKNTTGRYLLQINAWAASTHLKAGPGHTWQQANAIELNQTVFASADEVPWIPLDGTPRSEAITSVTGEDWYRFSFNEARPKLVYFQLELMDRDDLPVDVSVFREQGGKLTAFTDGQDPTSAPHEVQALPGNKFTPRVLKDTGIYYLRVRANHPEYKLRTRVYEAPPYADPRQAVRAGVDYLMGAGDSWFANTPRRGGTLDRITPVHQETSLCVGCHASHFPQRAQLYATAHGYPVVQRQQLQFLEERFYNNPRPFYGFEDEGAVWSRVISAPANVLSRMSTLTGFFEEQVSRTPRPAYHDRISKYLDIYYKGFEKLPPDETNGNTPLVSAFEVGWYSWKTTHDARLPGMLAEAPVKNMVDLCYQTLALTEIDRTLYAAQIGKNTERLLSLQRPDGQWSMRFEPSQPAVEFQTGHVLWALASAGIPAEHPQVKKAIDYLLGRQQPYGAWMDPLQSFENFKTPFRETQFAVLALSTYFPLPGRAKGWNAAVLTHLSENPAQLLGELDEIWEVQSPAVMKELQAAAQGNDAFVRQAATEALGRLSRPEDAPVFIKLLGDPSKLVQRTAAWALRQVYSNHPETSSPPLLAALASPAPRVRWGATRVFAHHFSELARRAEFVSALNKLAGDPVITVRMQAIRALWQAWFWTPDTPVRERIEETILASLKTPQHPWIETNLHAAVYNMADENIRYLYNNWVALLPKAEDRERAIRGRLAVESRLAAQFTDILNNGPDYQKKQLLASLADPPQRRGDIYDLSADLSKPAPLVYSRIGNDIEQIAFFGSSAGQFATALRPLLDSPDKELRGLAIRAALLVRETPFPETERVAGGRADASREIGKKVSASPDAVEVSTAFFNRPAGLARTPVARNAVAAVKLDEAVFRANIDPLFRKKGPDGYACINCHGTHTLFNATWATVMNVVDTRDPENSPILRKPTATAEAEGVVDARVTAHGGGQRWTKGSPEYDAILKWIQGAKL